MKKISNKIYIIAVGSMLIMGACKKDFISKTPYDALPADQALSTTSGLQDALLGAYASLRSPSLFGRDFPVSGDLQADNSFVETKNAGRYLTQYNYSVTASDGVPDEMWSQAYVGILRANRVIEANVTGTNVAQIKAQAYAIRALLYFKLVNIFAKPYTDAPSALGVPIVLKYDPFYFPARSKVSEVYTQIITDLQAAFKSAPAYSNSVTLSKYAIEGILAKVYLYQGDNANAKKAAVDVIANSGISLLSYAAYNAFWLNAGIRTDKVETLFEVDQDAINNNGYDDLGGIYYNGYQDIYASSQLYLLYSNTDIRQSLLMPGTTKSGASANIIVKYPNTLNPDKDNLKVMRLSEVYLIAAEASLPGNELDAIKYLNLLLAQRDPAFTGYTSTGVNLLNDIVNERRKELAFEGDRLYDLNRLKLGIQRVSNAGAIAAGVNNVNLAISYSDYRRIAPIPQGEIQANLNITNQQNTGY